MKKLNKVQTGGFTLVELLVVVGIIALLIAILLPSLARAREQSRMTKCLSNQREVGKAAATFQNDHKSRLQLVADEYAIDSVDPQRNVYAYFEYPTNPYSNSLASPKNKELLTWTVAYGETAGYSFNKKNWKWGARCNNIDTAVNAHNAAIEKDVLNWAVCPSDKHPGGALGNTGFPNLQQFSSLAVGGFNPTLLSSGNDAEVVDSANSPSNARYFGQLSYAINEDIVGKESGLTYGSNATDPVIPGCYKGAGTAGLIGGVDNGNSFDLKAGFRLAGDLDKVFQPSRTALVIDGGDDQGPDFRGGDRTMVINSDNFIPVASTNATPTQFSYSEVRADLGSFMRAHMGEGNTRDPATQVLPTQRHTDGRLNALKADMSAESYVPVRFTTLTNGFKIPVIYAETLFITPYEVEKGYDPATGL